MRSEATGRAGVLVITFIPHGVAGGGRVVEVEVGERLQVEPGCCYRCFI